MLGIYAQSNRVWDLQRVAEESQQWCMEPNYFAQVQARLSSSAQLSAAGFEPQGVEVWGKGADRNPLLQVKKPSWRLECVDGLALGYRGIEVHWESCRPGHWVLHCELWPRQGKDAKGRVLGPRYESLLELKGDITRLIREEGEREGWASSLGAHLKRARDDARDPSSLIAYTFELGLNPEHTPADFVSRVLPIVAAASPVVDEILVDTAPGALI